MKRTRRLGAIAATFAVAALGLAACSSGGDAKPPAAEESGATTETPAAEEPAGDGGGDIAGKKVAFVPKIQGIPYFEAMNVGGQAAAAELGIEWIYQGPTEADPAAQADIVRSLVQQKVDAIVVAPNDPDSLAPVLQEAKDAGIAVLTSDTDAPNSVRQVFVNQASAQALGTFVVDTLAEAMGGKGQVAIVSCGETAENLNTWIEIEKEAFAQKYPDIKMTDLVYAGEDMAKATEMATDLMNANPDLNGLIGQCTTSAPGVAQAVRDAGRIGEVFTVGIGTPQAMLPYLEDGSSSGSILWDVEALGFLSAWAGAQVAAGNDIGAALEAGPVGGTVTDASFDPDTLELLLGDPLVLTKDNAANFDY